MADYFIIEHRSRGVLVDKELDDKGERTRYKFSYSILRTDEKVWQFHNVEAVSKVADEISGAYVLRVTKYPHLKIRRLDGSEA